MRFTFVTFTLYFKIHNQRFRRFVFTAEVICVEICTLCTTYARQKYVYIRVQSVVVPHLITALFPSVQGCDKPTKTQRYRTVLRRPALGSGVKCPHVVESELSDLGVNFFKVNWQWSEWGACVLDPGVPCGRGLRKRHRQCLRTDGQATLEENCRQVRRWWLVWSSFDGRSPADGNASTKALTFAL